ncbi:Bug family tripartite tricarboxylate transporter substrate binding protein [Teichococcus vastitatis]|uniref:Tripartite tricarboxylate transporter substrate binding protein n=1 Tax=Teichococcus vastitatis TaxID=2307076 RepID=A0ABS9W2H3_9PROT|nr:tripartite tricarboxylate transporter substrate binding protein [Pseudoroseomonas vastitatis]MCI0753486.1 tripartite tricarboxylate transporter substrate binding protein [Pseudoroseomonas vastitatis]
MRSPKSFDVGRRALLGTGVAMLGLAMPRLARAAFPDRPVRLIIPYGPGGQTDIVSRLIGEAMGQRLGQPVLADNRPGAAGNLAAEMTARSPTDGYTIMVGSTGALGGVNAALYKNLGYDWQQDFAPIGLFCTTPNVILVNTTAIPVNSLTEFIEFVSTRPGQLNFASSGIGATTHLSMELLLERAKLSMVHVPYRQSTQGMTDLLAGRVQARCLGLPEAEPVKTDSRVRAIAVTSAARSPNWPDVPAVAETLPNFVGANEFGLAAPAGTSAEIINRFNAALNEALVDPAVKAGFQRVGAEAVAPNSPDTFSGYVRQRGATWTALIQRLGLSAE